MKNVRIVLLSMFVVAAIGLKLAEWLALAMGYTDRLASMQSGLLVGGGFGLLIGIVMILSKQKESSTFIK